MQEVSFDDFNQNPDKYPTGLEHLYIAMSYDFEENLGNKYEKCKLYRKLFENFGYTFDFGLDGEPIDLKKNRKTMTTTQKKKLKLTNQLQSYFVENKLSVNEHVLSNLSVLSLKKQQMIVEGIIFIFEQLFNKYSEIKNTKILGYEYELKINDNISYLFIIRVSGDGISMMGKFYTHDNKNNKKIKTTLKQLSISSMPWKYNLYFFFDGCDRFSYKNNTIKLRLDVFLYRLKKLNQNI